VILPISSLCYELADVMCDRMIVDLKSVKEMCDVRGETIKGGVLLK